ncbi:MAG: metallophosphoesterase [Burkholderiales bacterium]|jgi:predicted MPP superfamily phosphohydrolase|nr:metallophosphoesterase [Burkholderiales bacterium]
MSLFFILVLSALLAVATYLGVRFYKAFCAFFPGWLKHRVIYGIIFFVVIVFFPVFSLMAPFIAFYVNAGLGISPDVAYMGSLLLAFIIVAFTTTFVLDMAGTLIFLLPPLKPVSRFFKQKPHYPGVMVLVAIAIHFGLSLYWAHAPQAVYYSVAVPKPIGGEQKTLRVVHISDTHIAGYSSVAYHQSIIDKINALNPDLVVIAGDIVDRSVAPFEPFVDVFAQLKTRYGVFAILGNHEYFGESPDQAVKLYEKAGMRVLRDQAYTLPTLGITLIGRDDRIRGTPRAARFVHSSAQEPRASLATLMEQADPSKPIFVVSHQPVELETSARLGVDIEFSGHTHDGQFFPINLIVAFLYQNPWGVWHRGNYTSIVTCGLGTWGPPIRSPSRSEIVVADITFAQ